MRFLNFKKDGSGKKKARGGSKPATKKIGFLSYFARLVFAAVLSFLNAFLNATPRSARERIEKLKSDKDELEEKVASLEAERAELESEKVMLKDIIEKLDAKAKHLSETVKQREQKPDIMWKKDKDSSRRLHFTQKLSNRFTRAVSEIFSSAHFILGVSLTILTLCLSFISPAHREVAFSGLDTYIPSSETGDLLGILLYLFLAIISLITFLERIRASNKVLTLESKFIHRIVWSYWTNVIEIVDFAAGFFFILLLVDAFINLWC